MDTALSKEKEYKGVVGGSWHERDVLQRQRDDKIVELVDHLEVADHRLIAAGLGLDNTPSTLASIGRRMKRLAGLKSEYKYFQLVKQNVTFAVTLDISIRKSGERAELAHRYQQARI